MIELDVAAGRLDLLVERDELVRRSEAIQLPEYSCRGYEQLYRQHVLQASGGCDFDFLRADSVKTVTA
jgi:dihydroxy-acid dehydratase